jgi:hypothetical protein
MAVADLAMPDRKDVDASDETAVIERMRARSITAC